MTASSSATDLHGLHSEDLQKVKWAGWMVVGTLLCSWIVWISTVVITNARTGAVLDSRQQVQYERLREDIQEIKELLKNRYVVKP